MPVIQLWVDLLEITTPDCVVDAVFDFWMRVFTALEDARVMVLGR